MSNSANLGMFFMLYFLIFGVAMLNNSKFFTKAASSLVKDSSHILVTGFITTLFGIFIVSFHGYYVLNKWPVVITIIGWITIFKGMLYLFSEKRVKQLVKSMGSKESVKANGVLMLILAAFFAYNLYY